ncbi:MAG TPA: FAD-dependent oxidoreductase [Solirubrobacteraceae bacterium]
MTESEGAGTDRRQTGNGTGPNDGEPIKVAVLGGGVGAMVAAFELTRPELAGRFEVTVYQPGWRLGGKGASGRTKVRGGQRIEEHGLHVWFGFYENAFAVMRDAYQELADTDNVQGPFRTVWDAFKGCEEIVAFDQQGSDWVQFAIDDQPNPGLPGDGTDPKGFWEIAEELAAGQLKRWQKTFWKLLRRNFWRPSFWVQLGAAFVHGRSSEHRQFKAVADQLSVSHQAHHYATGQHLLRLAGAHARQNGRVARAQAAGGGQVAPAPPGDGGLAETAPEAGSDPSEYVELLIAFRDFVWEHFVERRVDIDPELRFFFTTLDAWVCGAAGVISDGVLERGWDAINDLDLCEWLQRNGAKEVTIGVTPDRRSPMLRAIYDLAFAYLDGDIQQPSAAAGTAASLLLRLVFGHSGSMLYKMQAGMGDAVFGPFYRVLSARGVKFEFFTAVTRLGLDPQSDSVNEIDVVKQMELADPGAGYRPLCFDADPWCWPSQPLWDQLADGGTGAAAGPDLLTSLEQGANPMNGAARTLHRGSDFHHVVLGISVGALRPICGELMARNPTFKKAIETARTTPTQGFQLWLRRSTSQLGWTHGVNSVAGAYVEPIDTYCDMSHLIETEGWPPSAGVQGVAYFCGVLERVQDETQAQATARVKVGARELLAKSIAALWPKGVQADGTLAADVLAGDSPDGFDDQYYRANIAGTELYVLTPAGTVADRIPSDASGFDNLVLAGDWTKNGIDGGCVESAAASGRQAAQKLTGAPAPVPGEHRAWLKAAPEPPFVEYGALETYPGQFQCTGASFLAMVLKADHAKLQALLTRVLDGASAGSVRHRPLGRHAVLMVGQIDRICSTAPEFANRGYAAEWQAALTVPVICEVKKLGVFVPDHIRTFMPYLLVNNPISLCGGREIYGFAKALGRFPEPPPQQWRQTGFAIEAFGGDFAPDRGAGWNQLIQFAPTGTADGFDEEWSSIEDFVRHLLARVGHLGDRDLPRPHLTLPWGVIARTFVHPPSQISLKQFRASDAPDLASSSQLIETPLVVDRISGRLSKRDWHVTVNPLDSHPIADDLGLDSQDASFAFELEMDFKLG